MKRIKYIHLIGIWAFGILLGTGHLSFEFFSPRSPEITQQMQSMTFEFSGKVTSMYSITQAISIIMGVMLIAYGVTQLAIAKSSENKLPTRGLLYLNAFIVFVAFLLAIKYLFLLQVALIGISLICAIITLILLPNALKQAQ